MTTSSTGYCSHCQRIVDLDLFGNLAAHGYTSCAGQYTAPGAVPTAPEVAEAAFSDEKRQGCCPECGNPDAVIAEANGRVHMAAHPGQEPGTLCTGSWATPEYA
jgi:hypothetical protein